MARDFLWEIGTEEIPARFLPDLIEQLTRLSGTFLDNAGLEHGPLRALATPRRLALLAGEVAELAADVTTESKGPAVKAAYDESGAPTKALLGFCRGQGLTPGDLTRRELNGVPYVFAIKQTPGRPALELLSELIPTVAGQLNFAKPMRWGDNPARFVRPIRWMTALFGPELVEVEFAGVKSGRSTRGHRFLGSQDIPLDQAGQYEAKLRENYVIVDQGQRLAMITEQIQATAAAAGGQLGDDYQELAEEVAYLLEYPTALLGGFGEEYLELPPELIVTPMRDQQRYFPVYDQEGRLLPRFITVRNGDDKHLDVVAAGNEKVLRARLADAEFFYREDLADRPELRVEKLAGVVFHEKLGSLGQKAARLMALAEFIGQELGYSDEELEQTRRAAYLCKGDLCSRVVYEFPELQGIIGEYYARAAGEDQATAQAIREHYLPRFAGDDTPQTRPGLAVALGDKLDTLAAFFAIGLVPSGSADPFALRRAAAGCVHIILSHELTLALGPVLAKAFALLAEDIPQLDQGQFPERQEQIFAFLQQRLENALTEQGIAYDEVNAITGVSGRCLDLLSGARRARALHQVRGQSHFHQLLSGFHRAANILRSAGEKAGLSAPATEADPQLFAHDSEQALFAAIAAAEAKVKPLTENGDYAGALTALSRLSGPIDAFFESVMVMDDDPAIRDNRLALLGRMVAMADAVADLREIVE